MTWAQCSGGTSHGTSTCSVGCSAMLPTTNICNQLNFWKCVPSSAADLMSASEGEGGNGIAELEGGLRAFMF